MFRVGQELSEGYVVLFQSSVDILFVLALNSVDNSCDLQFSQCVCTFSHLEFCQCCSMYAEDLVDELCRCYSVWTRGLAYALLRAHVGPELRLCLSGCADR